jgi:glycosyltransferase involved in cell wall biosynthesis
MPDNSATTSRTRWTRGRADERILVLAKDIRHEGGYYEFVSLLLHREANSLEYLRVGRPFGDSTMRGKLLSAPLDQLRLARHLLRQGNPCVLVNTSMDASAFVRDALLVMLVTVIFRRRVVIQVHGWQDPFVDTIRTHRLLRLLFRKFLGKADCIIILAARFKPQLLGMGIDERRIRIGSSMFDGTLLALMDEAARPRKHQQLLFLSRLTREKGAHRVLEAFATLRQHFVESELVIAGDGPERETLAAAAQALGLEACVRLPGYVRNAAKATLLAESSVFVLPTTYGEGMPIAMLEAMAAGLPVVVTGAGAMGELLVDGVHGAVLRTGEPHEIHLALERLFADPDELRRIGKRNQSLASGFEAGIVSKAIVELCREVTAQPRGRP